MVDFKSIFNEEFKVNIIANTIFKSIKLIIVILPLMMFFIFFSVSSIPTTSMEPTISRYDMVISKKGNNNIKRNDIVHFVNPFGEQSDLLKRVIALPEESIAIKDNKVFINNIEIEDKYSKEGVGESFSGKVLTNSYFLVGDNRYNSFDSRNFGSVSIDDINGKVVLIIPLSKLIKIFK